MAGALDFTNQNIEDTYQRVVQTDDGSTLYDGTGSLLTISSTDTLENVVARGNIATTPISASVLNVDEIQFNNTNLFGNPIFHGDVNVYSSSAFLDEYDHEIFRSNASSQGTGSIQFGGLGLKTLVQGNGITIDVGDITQPSPDNIFLVKIEDDTKFTINNQGVTILGEQTSTPTAVEGGIYYSSSAFFVGVE